MPRHCFQQTKQLRQSYRPCKGYNIAKPTTIHEQSNITPLEWIGHEWTTTKFERKIKYSRFVLGEFPPPQTHSSVGVLPHQKTCIYKGYISKYELIYSKSMDLGKCQWIHGRVHESMNMWIDPWTCPRIHKHVHRSSDNCKDLSSCPWLMYKDLLQC